jgi:transcriptional regulator with XRE-family HTH domain
MKPIHFSQSDLARAAGCHQSAINKILRGKRRPSLELAKRLEKVTGVPWQSWLDPEEFRNPILENYRRNNGDMP